MKNQIAEVGTVQTFKKKALSVEGIQFTGTNGKDVVEFIRNTHSVFDVKNGGNYVKVTFLDPEDDGEVYLPNTYNVRKGQVVVHEVGGYLAIYKEEDFKTYHVVSKNNAVVFSDKQ